MDIMLDFFKSDIGIGIAWICTVGSTIYAMLKQSEVKVLKLKIKNYKSNVGIDNGQDAVTQNGDKSIYTKHNSGGMNIHM